MQNIRLQLYRQGKPDRVIADAVGCSRETVTSWRRAMDLPVNKQHFQTEPVVVDDMPERERETIRRFGRDLLIASEMLSKTPSKVQIGRFIKEWQRIGGFNL